MKAFDNGQGQLGSLPKSVRKTGRDVYRWFDNPLVVLRFIIILQYIVA